MARRCPLLQTLATVVRAGNDNALRWRFALAQECFFAVGAVGVGTTFAHSLAVSAAFTWKRRSMSCSTVARSSAICGRARKFQRPFFLEEHTRAVAGCGRAGELRLIRLPAKWRRARVLFEERQRFKFLCTVDQHRTRAALCAPAAVLRSVEL